MTPSITILRLGHRPQRDMRVTTHVALVGRALGADGMVLTTDDHKLKATIEKVCSQFGGDFSIRFEKSRKGFISNWKKQGGKIVHLTMYGEHIDDRIKNVRGIKEDILIIVGAEKVPRDIYDMADYNIAVGNQPHSEIAALAIFLDRLLDGKGLNKDFNGNMTIEPNPKGKTMRVKDDQS